MGRKTPEEVFTGIRPDMSHIRIFASVCYCHVHANTRKKLDPSREKGLLAGYSETSKAYRVYIPSCKRIIVSRDVQFDEDRPCRDLWTYHQSNNHHMTHGSSWRS